MIGGGLVLAAVLNCICDQYGWLPPERCREICGNAFLPFALINTFLYDEPTPTIQQLQEAYWKAGYLLMVIDDRDYEELYRAITSGSLQDSKYYLNNGIKREKAVKDFLSAGGPKGDKAKFLKDLYDKSKKRCNDGWNELKEGDVANGLVDITIGLWGFDLWGSILALEVIPKEALSQIQQEILRILS